MLIQTLLSIARGEGTDGKPVRPADQIRAVELVLAYGWGKPAAHVTVEGQETLGADDVTREIAAIAAELHDRRNATES